MKALLALASLVGITVKGDETEDQLTDLIAAYKPAVPKVEMNLEDPETKKLFDDAVAAGCAAIKSEFTAEITKLQALVKNGAAAAAGAGAPVPATGTTHGKTKEDQIADLQSELSGCKDSRERGKIIVSIAKLRAE
jgi:hypothetical protein